MNQYCVVVANGSRARLFSLESAEFPELESGPNLVEIIGLTNPEKNVQNRELWSEVKTGRNRGSKSGQAHGYDDHRSQHSDEYERRFASSIAEHTCKLMRRQNASNVVLVSQKRMLGFLRSALQAKLNGVARAELAKDLSKLNPRDLHDHLARERLIPERRSPAA